MHAHTSAQEKMCFREEAGQCLNEDHRFYESAHNGLDALMRRFITEAKLLSMDDEQDATFLSTRFDFIYQVGAAARAASWQVVRGSDTALFSDLADTVV
eukprot:1161810-Pelagomonas_calceolata.AAC.4